MSLQDGVSTQTHTSSQIQKERSRERERTVQKFILSTEQSIDQHMPVKKCLEAGGKRHKPKIIKDVQNSQQNKEQVVFSPTGWKNHEISQASRKGYNMKWYNLLEVQSQLHSLILMAS